MKFNSKTITHALNSCKDVMGGITSVIGAGKGLYDAGKMVAPLIGLL